MAIRTEQTKSGSDIIIDGFEQGIASSPYTGIANMVNMNNAYYPSVAYVNYKRKAATLTQSTDAITLDNFNSGAATTGTTTVTYSHTTTGSNRLLIVGVQSQSGDTISSVTYGGVAMTQTGTTVVGSDTTQQISLYYLLNPKLGTNTVLATRVGSTGSFSACSASYIEVLQSSFPNVVTQGTGTNSVTTSVTTTLPNAFAIAFAAATNVIAGTGETLVGNPVPVSTSVTQTFTSTTTWTAPTGVTAVAVEAWGGGGGSGSAQSGSGVYGASGGGGGGAYSKLFSLSVTPNTTYTVTVGSGGTAGSNSNGGTGGDSWFNTSGTIIAKGGAGGGQGSGGVNGAGGAGGASASGIGDILYSGGAGASGNYSGNTGGGGGGGAGTTSVGGAASGGTGGTAGTGDGTAGAGGNQGVAGSPKSGAGGGVSPTFNQTLNGFAGAVGYIRITYTTSINANIALFSSSTNPNPTGSVSMQATTPVSGATTAQIMVAFAPFIPTGGMTNPVQKAQSPAGLNYILDDSGSVWKQSAVNSSTFTELNGGSGRLFSGAGGLAYWNNYLFVFGAGAIEVCGNGTGDTGIISSNWNIGTGQFPQNKILFNPQQFICTAGITSGSTTATLGAVWPYPTNNSATITFSDGETRVITVTNGSASLSWVIGLTNTVTATVTIDSPGVYTNYSNGGLTAGQQIVFSTTGTLPAPLVAGKYYYATETSVSVGSPLSPSGKVTTISTTPGGANIILTSLGTGSNYYGINNGTIPPVGNITGMTFTADMMYGDTSATISSYTLINGQTINTFWILPTGTYNLVDSNGNNILMNFTYGSSSVTFTSLFEYSTGSYVVQILNPSVTNKAYVSKNDGNLYFSNGESMGSFVIIESNTTFNPQLALNYQLNYATFTLSTASNIGSDSIVDMIDLGDNMIIAGNKLIYTWNYTSSFTNNTVVPVNEPIVKLVNNLNLIYVFTNEKGNIYTSNGSYVQFFLKLPDYISGVFDPVWNMGDAISKRSRIFFQALAKNTSGTNLLGGVFSLAVSPSVIGETPQGLIMDTQNSVGLVPASGATGSGLLINAEPSSNGQTSYYTVYSTGASSGAVDYNDTTLWQNNEPFIETDIVPIGNYLVKGTLGSIEIKLDRPLATGDSVSLYWRPSLTDSYTQIPFIDTSLNLISNYGITSINQVQWSQFKVTFKCASSGSSFIPLREIRLHINQS